MLEGLFRAMIGEWGMAVIDWTANHPGVVLFIAAVWLAMLFLGRAQLNAIRKKTETWVLESAKRILAETPGLSASKLYEKLYPAWSENLRGSAVYILHRWEIFPVPATPRFVKDRINFTPEWLGGFLWANGIKLPGSKAPEKPDDPGYLPKIPS